MEFIHGLTEEDLSGHDFFFIFNLFLLKYCEFWASLVAQLVKNPPAMWETWVGSLGWEDPL